MPPVCNKIDKLTINSGHFKKKTKKKKKEGKVTQEISCHKAR